MQGTFEGNAAVISRARVKDLNVVYQRTFTFRQK